MVLLATTVCKILVLPWLLGSVILPTEQALSMFYLRSKWHKDSQMARWQSDAPF